MLPHDKTIAEIIQPNAEDEHGDFWDPWEALGIGCCSYNSELDQAAIAVLRHIASPDFMYCTDIAERTGLSPVLVEMFQGIFSSANWCEYGTSPRGCWFIDREGAPAMVAAWEAYYERQWGEPASCDTLPKGQDAKQGLAGTESGAVGEAETPKGQSHA